MKLTPIDIKKQEFKRTLRGYDHVEVDAFLETLSSQWELLLNEKAGMEQRIRDLEMEIQKFKQVENMLHQTLAQAQQSSTSTVENAKKEAEIIKHEAQVEATRMIDNATTKVETINQNIQHLLLQRHEIISKLKILLSSQMELLDSLQKDSENAIHINTDLKNESPNPSNGQLESRNIEPIELKEPSLEKTESTTSKPDAKSDPDNFFEPISSDNQTKPEDLPTAQTSDKPLDSDQNSLSSQTTRIEVPLEEPRKKAAPSRDLNIDDILDSLE